MQKPPKDAMQTPKMIAQCNSRREEREEKCTPPMHVSVPKPSVFALQQRSTQIPNAHIPNGVI
jgi:hypothetical protein